MRNEVLQVTVGGTMKSTKTVLIAVGLMLACGPAWSQTAAPAPAPARGAPGTPGELVVSGRR